jgi:hypothetical protein
VECGKGGGTEVLALIFNLSYHLVRCEQLISGG